MFRDGVLEESQATNIDGVRKKIAQRAVNCEIKDRPNKEMLFYRFDRGLFDLMENHMKDPKFHKHSLVIKEVISRKRRLNR